MADSNLSGPVRNSVSVTHGLEPSAPLPFNPHAPSYQPFQHQPYHSLQNHRSDVQPFPFPNACPPSLSNQSQRPFSDLHHGNYPGVENCPPPSCPYWQQQLGRPRLLPSLNSGHSGERLGANGSVGVDSTSSTFRQPVMHNYPTPHAQYSQGYEPYIPPGNPAAPFDRQQHYSAMSLHPPTRNVGEPYDTPAPAPNRGSPSRPRHSYQNSRRQSQQESYRHSNRSLDHPERRMAVLLNTPGYRSERAIQTQTSNRRDFDSFSYDPFQPRSSSDAEEAAARMPPSFRSRRMSREPQPRSFARILYGDRAIDRQVQELKDKLPRLLFNELALDVSRACDICAKDYSCNRVNPCEEEEVAIELPCGHHFGEFCIFQWFDTCHKYKNKVTCPMCRKQLIEQIRDPATLFDALSRGPGYQALLASELRMGDFAHM